MTKEAAAMMDAAKGSRSPTGTPVVVALLLCLLAVLAAGLLLDGNVLAAFLPDYTRWQDIFTLLEQHSVGQEDCPHSYCEWNETSDECFDMLSTSCVRLPDNPTWVFLGDSTVQQIVKVLLDTLPLDIVSNQTATDPSENLELLDLPRSSNWIQPNKSRFEGPLSSDLKFRTGCMRCVNRLFRVHNRTNALALSFLAVEFARDVEYPTPNTTTTQETMALFLSKNSHPNICIPSVGQHDSAISNITTETYVTNVRHYLQQLDSACDHIIWLGLNAVLGIQRYPQSNPQLYEFNQGVYRVLKTDYAHKSSIVDVWNASIRLNHFNNVHMGDDYTHGLARMFHRLIERTL